jgi:protein-disulfide isomerase
VSKIKYFFSERGTDLNIFEKSARVSSEQVLIGCVLALCLLFSGTGQAEQGNQPSGKLDASSDAAPKKEAKQAEPSGDIPTLGPADAPVVIVEFSDFQCPYCARAAKTMEELKKFYGNKIRFEFRHFPLKFHKDAQLAAEAAEEARLQGKFWEYRALLFENARQLKRQDLESYAQQLELDLGKFRAALDNHTHAPVIERDIAAGKSHGVRGVPGFVINGELTSGAKPFDSFRQLIDPHLTQ